MKKQKATLGAVPAYEPDGFARPTPGEIRNGWTAHSLTDYLRKQAVSDYEFRHELCTEQKNANVSPLARSPSSNATRISRHRSPRGSLPSSSRN
jgi:hypothetical protein